MFSNPYLENLGALHPVCISLCYALLNVICSQECCVSLDTAPILK